MNNEWTAQDVYRIIRDAGDGAHHALADAHNDALAATAAEVQTTVVNTFKQQLAAERELSGERQAVIVELGEQLDAEREEREIVERSRDAWINQVSKQGKEIQQLRDQLAGVVEARQPLVDALTKIERVATDQQWFRAGIIATDALAKVKEGKV